MISTLWTAAALMLISAAMLLAGVGSAGLWIAIIVVGLALVILSSRRGGRTLHR
jgi:hypothetical protein